MNRIYAWSFFLRDDFWILKLFPDFGASWVQPLLHNIYCLPTVPRKTKRSSTSRIKYQYLLVKRKFIRTKKTIEFLKLKLCKSHFRHKKDHVKICGILRKQWSLRWCCGLWDCSENMVLNFYIEWNIISEHNLRKTLIIGEHYSIRLCQEFFPLW
jgi:hypothetical protein